MLKTFSKNSVKNIKSVGFETSFIIFASFKKHVFEFEQNISVKKFKKYVLKIFLLKIQKYVLKNFYVKNN